MTDHETQGAVLTGIGSNTGPAREHINVSALEEIIATQSAALDEMRGALEAARHALVTYQGLSALDGFGTYYQAQDDGADQNGAFDALRESSWVLNDEATLAVIDAALATTSDAGDRQGEVRCDVCGGPFDNFAIHYTTVQDPITGEVSQEEYRVCTACDAT